LQIKKQKKIKKQIRLDFYYQIKKQKFVSPEVFPSSAWICDPVSALAIKSGFLSNTESS